jgi:hypothetical protein
MKQRGRDEVGCLEGYSRWLKDVRTMENAGRARLKWPWQGSQVRLKEIREGIG